MRVLVERLGNTVGAAIESMPIQLLDDVMAPLAFAPRAHILEGLHDDLLGGLGLLRADRHLGHLHGRRAADEGGLLEVGPASSRLDLVHQPVDRVERVIKDRGIGARVAQAVRVRAGGGREFVGVPVFQRPGRLQDGVIRVENLHAVDQRVEQSLGGRNPLAAVGMGPDDGGIGILLADLQQRDSQRGDRRLGAVDQHVPEVIRFDLLSGQNHQALGQLGPPAQVGQLVLRSTGSGGRSGRWPGCPLRGPAGPGPPPPRGCTTNVPRYGSASRRS